ncbi:MAG: amidohydrolase [Tindallia sp. MSAO_Bac2]|nr:MAG: amidohydrolase [Tindallia sp. MSAO_Bac2]
MSNGKVMYHNANLINFPDMPDGDAFIVENGKFEKVGATEVLKKEINDSDELIDLQNKTVIPGLTDSHIHLLAYGSTKEQVVSLKEVRSMEELKSKVAQHIDRKALTSGQWVKGSGWNHDTFPDRKVPDRQDLDSISREHPIMLLRMCYHICSVNTKALEMAGITRDTPDPEGGKIDRDANGNPTGVLRETAMELVKQAIPPIVDKDEIKDLILSATEDLVSLGFTTVHTDDFGFVGDRQALLDAYKELNEQKKLPLQIVMQMIIHNPEDIDFYIENNLQSWNSMGRLMPGPIKILGDGSLGSRTAALHEPYSDDPETSGFMLMSEERLDAMIKKSFENGFDVAAHGIGDKTTETMLDLFKKYEHIYKPKNLRPSVIHSQIGSDSILRKYRDQQVIANVQPIFTHSDLHIAEDRIGSKRLKYSYCWKTYLDMGIPTVGSSDSPVESFNPFWNIYTAVARKDLEGNPKDGWIMEEALSLQEAMELFTLKPPMLSDECDTKGQLKEGYEANFTVLDKDPFKVDIEELKDFKAHATYFRGEKVYE